MLKNSKQKPTYSTLNKRLSLEDKRMSALEGIAAGYYESDLHGSMMIVNDSLCEIFGCDSDADLLGDSYHRFLDEANNHRLREAFAQVAASGDSTPAVECAITRADGASAWIELSAAPVRTATGRINGFRGIVRDVSDRHRAQETLLDRQRQLQQLTTELSQTLNLDEVLDTAIRAASTLTQADGGFIGLIEQDRARLARVFGGFKEQWVPLDLGIIARVIRTQKAELIENVASDADYRPDLPATRAEIVVPLASRGSLVGVLNLETSQPEHFTRELFDTCQVLGARIAAAIKNAQLYKQQQAELEELNRKYKQISELEELKTDMIRVAAHNLRNPLSLIGNYTDILAQDLAPHLGAQQKQFIEAIRQSVERMKQMTTDILSLERLNQHRDETLMRVQLGTLLERVVNQYANESRNRGQHIHVYSEPVSFYGDPSEILEAIANLVGNAVKYTPNGGQIEAHLLREGDMAVLKIIDSGYGVPADQIENLFQPFHRIRTQETQNIDGTGLGLYLVKKIVERHQGRVFVESDYGRGSTFGFRLPLAK